MNELFFKRAQALKLHGILAHWDEIKTQEWLKKLLDWEENERSSRGLKRRFASARIQPFKSLADFDWEWPKKCDRFAIEELMALDFIKDTTNVIFCGPNGVGKSTIACNIANQAVLQGHTVLFTTAADMLNDLTSQDGDNALRRRIKYYSQPGLLIIDEIGYLSYSNRHADLLFAIISNRYQKKPTIVTTNKPFSEWHEIFPNATSVVSLVDRLVHHSEIVSIEAESYRLKEAKEQTEKRKKSRPKPKSTAEKQEKSK